MIFQQEIEMRFLDINWTSAKKEKKKDPNKLNVIWMQ